MLSEKYQMDLKRFEDLLDQVDGEICGSDALESRQNVAAMRGLLERWSKATDRAEEMVEMLENVGKPQPKTLLDYCNEF